MNFPDNSVVKNPQSMNLEGPLEKEMAAHLSTLGRESPWTGESSRCVLCPWGHKSVGHDLATKQQITITN